ncbi:MAG: PBSX family phage terminase large subunit, partial [Candidatus Thorarchaeota archaeon]|nr:PBSX family phage terminase large subunit [Candidatus Thorarchaeota archaeon]
ALIEVHRINDTTIGLQEVIYSKGLTNKDIYEKAKDLGVDFGTECIADSAEPKSIEELYQHGWTMIYPAVKGKDSINNGIQLLQQFDIVVTKSSVNVIKELRNYQWAKDKHGKELKKPE